MGFTQFQSHALKQDNEGDKLCNFHSTHLLQAFQIRISIFFHVVLGHGAA